MAPNKESSPKLPDTDPSSSVGFQQWIQLSLDGIDKRLDGIENRLRKVENKIWLAIGIVTTVGIILGVIFDFVSFGFEIQLVPKK